MTTTQEAIPIHPSIIIKSKDDCSKPEYVAICHSTITTVGDLCARKDSSLLDLHIILNDLIEGFNEGCQSQYQYKLASYSKHLWHSFEEFQNDNKLTDFNRLAVFCCPLSYLKEYNRKRSRANLTMKLLYQVPDEQLKENQDLKSLYADISSTEVREAEQIIIYETLQYATKTWFDMIDKMKLSSIQSTTAQALSRRGTF